MKQKFYLLTALLIFSVCTPVMAQSWEEEASSDGSEPTARHENAFAEVNGKFYLIGGRHARPVNEYDPVSRTWTEKSEPPVQMHHFQAVSLNGKIYIIGAFTGNFPDETPMTHVYIYDPAGDTWTEAHEIPVARRRGSAGAVLYNGKIYVIGGITNGHNSGAVPWFDVYDPATGIWTALTDAPQARDHFQAAVVNGKIVAAGGRTTSYATGQLNNLTVNTADVYDFGSGQWSTVPAPIPTPRAGTAAAAVNNEVLVIGGESASQLDAHDQTEALNITTGTWRTLSPLNTGRHGTQAILFGSDLYITAGSMQKGGNATTELASLEVLNVLVLTAKRDLFSGEFRISPNPAGRFLMIEELPPGIYTAEIRDPAGREVWRESIIHGRIDVSGLKPGVYFLRISGGQSSGDMFRIVKH